MKAEDPSVGSLNEVLLTRVAFANDDFRSAAVAVGVRLSLRVEEREEPEESLQFYQGRRSATGGWRPREGLSKKIWRFERRLLPRVSRPDGTGLDQRVG